MACLASGMPTTAAVACFGSFADDGATYIAPSNSACRSWVGTTADGVSWRMLLADLGLPDGSMLGWIWDDQTLRWYAFDELTGRLSTGLSAAHRANWGTPERELSLTRSGADLVGQIRVFRGATRQVALALDPVVGTWTGPAGPLILMPLNLWEPATPTESVAPTQPTTPYLGRWLSSAPPTGRNMVGSRRRRCVATTYAHHGRRGRSANICARNDQRDRSESAQTWPTQCPASDPA